MTEIGRQLMRGEATLDHWSPDEAAQRDVLVALALQRKRPAWVSSDGVTRVAVRYQREDTRAAAIERVARHIARTTPALQFGWEFSRCDGAYFLRDRGWRLLPDDNGGVMTCASGEEGAG